MVLIRCSRACIGVVLDGELDPGTGVGKAVREVLS